MAPAPKSRIPKGEVVDSAGTSAVDGNVDLIDFEDDKKGQHNSTSRITGSDVDTLKENRAPPGRDNSSRAASDVRRNSTMTAGSDREGLLKRTNTAEMREHLKHLGPSNRASRPRQTRYNTVKIKPGASADQETPSKPAPKSPTRSSIPTSNSKVPSSPKNAPTGIPNPGAKNAQDGALAVLASYGTMNSTPNTPSNPPKSPPHDRTTSTASEPPPPTQTQQPSGSRSNSHSTLGSLNQGGASRPNTPRVKKSLSVSVARSGSITENIVEAGGIKKTVLELSSSSEGLSEQQGKSGDNAGGESEDKAAEEKKKKEKEEGEIAGDKESTRKKRRRRKRKDEVEAPGPEEENEDEDEGGERTPLTGGKE